jgi:hypothetical protein
VSAYLSSLSTLPNDASTFSTLRQMRRLPSCEISTTYEVVIRARALAWAVLLVNGGSNMFRISTIDTQQERRLVVEGTLVRPWVDELRKTWSSASNALEGRGLVIDLTNATVISREGESAIFDLMREGAKFSCGGVLTKHLLKELARRCHTTLSEVLNRNCAK